MKVTKKLLLLGLALTMLLTMSVPVFALPGNTVVVGEKAFSMDYFFDEALDDEIVDAVNEGGDIYFDVTQSGDNFIDAFSGDAVTDEQKGGLSDIEYLNYDGTRVVYENFDDKTPVQEEIVVENVAVVNNTTIEVSFSDGVVKTYTGKELVPGENKVTFDYKGKTYEETVTLPAPDGTSVENIELINYRNLKVTFDGLVDSSSAADPANYYFEIVDGNAAYGAIGIPTLLESNQLSKIETDYTSTNGWWGDGHIIAEDINGKTVVNIYLPEDARFTNEEDIMSGTYPYPYNAADTERTLGVEMRDSKTDGYILKKLLKDTTFNMAVRNIKDLDGKLSIDTISMPVRIIDEVRPELVGVKKVTKLGSASEANCFSYGKDLGSFSLLRTNPALGQDGESLQFIYSEPVFDAHRSDMSDLDWYRDITLYVNGKPLASLSEGDLNEYMKFEMGNSKYEDSKIVTIDVEEAVKAIDEEFAKGIEYIVQFVGVTDLAGNIEVTSDHTFKVSFRDDPVADPEIVMPVVLGVDQVADNIFRIEFNRAGVEGTFVLENPDGEGQGYFLERDIPLSAPSKSNGKFYSYVAVPACDSEDAEGIAIPEGIDKDWILSYDNNGTIYRDIRVEDVRVENDTVAQGTLYGLDFTKTMALTDDVKSPVAENPGTISYGGRTSQISIKVKDVTPWVDDENITPYWVSPIAYNYDSVTESFSNEIVPYQEFADTYLPIKVSYVDGAGATHAAMISNYDLDPDNGAPSDMNPGYRGSITWDATNDTLVLDLEKYLDLLDGDKKLVSGATYKIEIPKGYFTDSPLDLNFRDYEPEFTFAGNSYDLLYVDSARDNDDYSWFARYDSGLGYTSVEQTVTVDIGVDDVTPPPAQHVPQTSKQLIYYDEATNCMKIEFTGDIDVDTLKDKNNYSFNGKTLAQWDAELGTNTVIEYQVKNIPEFHQYAVFEIPQDSIQVYGNYEFTVQGVAHPDGAKMVPVTTEVRLEDVYRPVVIDAIVTGDFQIKLTFNEPVKYFVDTEPTDAHAVADNFIVKVDGVKLTLDTAVLPDGYDSDREITLNLGSEIPSEGAITVEIVKDDNGNILVIDHAGNKNPMKEAIYDVVRPAV